MKYEAMNRYTQHKAGLDRIKIPGLQPSHK